MRHTRSIFIGMIPLLCVLGLILSTTSRQSSRAAEEKSDISKADGNIAVPAKLSYNRDIRPILAENCFACHGPDSASRQAELRIDQRDAAIKMNAIVPNEPQNSEAIKRIFTADADELMPPPDSHKKLTKKQKETLTKWVNEGAEYEPHWSYIAPTRPALPKVKNEKWIRNPIDAFILRELEKNGLTPAPEADRRTLARRLSLDLCGLPPEPEEVEAFVNDTSSDYYEKYVDRLMATPQWGEHRARYWLDYARYADSQGIHYDSYREMWSFRDWLIKAMNDNIPFDRFTTETLAGDLLPNRTLDQEIASGFHRCAASSNEAGLIEDEYITLYTRDRTETTAQVWMGLTMNCAVCHDHKFDPITQKEFYQMSAFFNNIVQKGNVGAGRSIAPTITVPRMEDRGQWEQVVAQIKEKRAEIDSYKVAVQPDFVAWLEKTNPEEILEKNLHDHLHFAAKFDEGTGKTLHYTHDGQPKEKTLENDLKSKSTIFGSPALDAFPKATKDEFTFDEIGDFDAQQAFSFGGWIKTSAKQSGVAILSRMGAEKGGHGWDLWFEENRLAFHLVNHWSDDAIKVITKDTVKIRQFNHYFVTYDGSGKAAGVKIYMNGTLVPVEIAADSLKGSIKTNAPFKIGQREKSAHIDQLSLSDLRIYDRELTHTEVATLSISQDLSHQITKAKDRNSLAKNEMLKGFWLTNFKEAYQKLSSQLMTIENEEYKIKAKGTVAFVMREKESMPTAYILNRGEYDKRMDEVPPGTPASLPAFPDDLPRNRLGLAKWLLMPENPLTARVNVNRFWQEIFGTGIVRTVGDLGLSGELPSHPELLDWLAVEFRESGWDIKKFYKLLVTSAAYRQSSDVTPKMIEKDPQNLLISRGPRFRMDGEMVRDSMLSTSGLLVKKIGGPSVKPYQPDGVWEAVTIPESNTYAYKQDGGEKLYRRSMYTFWKRAAPPASMEIFNGPNRDSCVTCRDRTNTPLQALATLNDPQMVEAARALAQRTISDAKKMSTDERIDSLAQRLLSRTFTVAEKKVAADSVAELLAFYQKNGDDAKKLITVGESKPDDKLAPAELAAWTMLVNQLMNLDETLNK